jgi:hypothetical protein
MAVPVGPVVYQIYVNGRLIPDLPLDVWVEQTWGQHDIFAVRIEYNRGYPMNTISPWPDNAMVQIVWGRRPNALMNWYGYVNHHELASNADSGTHNLQYTYYCTGTSKPMNTETSRVWGSVTPTYIAKQLALKYHLRSVLTSTNWVLSSETQANMSDFDYLTYIADLTGFRWWVSGGTLYFIEPAVILAGTATQAVPVFRQDKQLSQQDTMRDFKLLRGDNLPGSTVANRQVFGIDQTSGHLFGVATGSGSVTKVNTARVATSLAGGSRIVSAWQGLSQFWLGASAELFGNSLLYPGKVVYLDGLALPGGNVGYWIVASAKHILKNSWTGLATNDKYVTQAVLMRNTSATIPAIRGMNVVSPEFVTCAPSNGVWFSSSLQTIYDGVVNV